MAKTLTTKFLKESIVANAVAKKLIKPEVAAQLLSEDVQTFTKGQDVYVAHGIHAGSYGKYLGEENGGYASVDLKAAGKTYLVPLIFLTKSANKLA